MATFFRVHPGDRDPQSLLDPAEHRCEPWGGSDDGSPCDKCGGSGETGFRCESCLATEADPDCPACGGRVEWTDRCPVCLGDGIIDGAPRHGVSVFPRLEGLLRYMTRRGSRLGHDVVVEVEGELTADVDFDADEGALLVAPTRIVRTLPAEAVV
jgi:DnaJ-class molecular chaperone